MNECTLCPRACHAERTPEKGNGFCGLPSGMVIARIQPHLWEEPPISGSRGTGAIFFSGCTLRCAYCQNGEISHRNQGRPFTPAQLADSMKRLVDAGMQTISFITATPYLEPVLETLELYRPPVPIVWNTSGYETVETIRKLNGAVDVYLPDLKHHSEAMGRLCAKAPDYFSAASAAITEMCKQRGPATYNEDGIMTSGVLIRHLILPGLTGESCQLLTWIRESLPEGVPVSLMRQYIPYNNVSIPGLDRKLTAKEYHRVRQHVIDLDLPGFLQEAVSADEGFVPVFNQPESFI